MCSASPRGGYQLNSGARKASKADASLGRRIRSLRLALKMSHRELAHAIGVSYQQLQKYERGMSRISVSRLQKMATALDVPISLLLEVPKWTPGGTLSVATNEIDIMDFISMDEGQELNIAFSRIADQNIRCKVAALVEVAAHAGD
ncbi:helix-turn-helix transcriptional regulator [Rhizobium leguminosarum]|uniref:helix-turn-helix domain-containing protein n=1 Tax=Rhizobium leguminosarum TaxID=384 RepID=UPI0028F3EFC7|nr:helix-turn-helix transcriptional regulator [Rhizobium leguminosarum]